MTKRASKSTVSPAEQKDGRGTDLFVWLDGLWNKRTPETGKPPMFMLHRFLAADPDYAPFCRALGQEVRESDLIYRTWQSLLPKGAGAPRLAYIAAKKAPAAEALVLRMCKVLGVRRAVVEPMVALVEQAGKADALYAEFGIERDHDDDLPL